MSQSSFVEFISVRYNLLYISLSYTYEEFGTIEVMGFFVLEIIKKMNEVFLMKTLLNMMNKPNDL
jgi:hypothetical protein